MEPAFVETSNGRTIIMPRTTVSLSQPSGSRQTQRNRSFGESTQTQGATQADPDFDEYVVNTVRVVLNLSVNKHPIKKTDVVKNALAGNGRVLPKILPQVIAELEDVYGYKLVETERNKTFLLVSKLASGSVLDLSEDFRQKYTLLYLVLGYIFMKNGNVPEQGLYDFLEKLNIPTNGEEHRFFGNAQRLITETFVKQAYLVRSKQVVEGMNDDRFFFSWGARADHELSKKDILESICKLMGKPTVVYVKQHMAAYGGNDEDEDEEDESMEQTQ